VPSANKAARHPVRAQDATVTEHHNGRYAQSPDHRQLLVYAGGDSSCPGAKITWANRDDIPHTVTDGAEPNTFKSPPLDTGDTFSFVFPTPGNISLLLLPASPHARDDGGKMNRRITYGEASLTRPRVYTSVMRSIHWITLSMLISVYTLAWSIDGAGSHDETLWLVMMHRSLGLSVMLLTLFRLGCRHVTRVPALPDGIPKPQRLVAKAVTIALYLLLFLQPQLGLIASQLHGDHINVFGVFMLPSVLAANRALSRQIFALHGTVALLLLALIGLHACAALYHHFVRRDEVLTGMLPGLPRLPEQGRGALENVPQ
jgi:superoxide oxidase